MDLHRRSRRATAFFPRGPRYVPDHHKCCLHSAIHDAIPYEHRIIT